MADIKRKLLEIFQVVIARIKSTLLKVGFTKDSIVGLDIGTSSIKLAQFIKKEDGLNLVKTKIVEIEHGSLKTSGEDKLLSSLKTALKGIDIKNSKFILSINCTKTCSRTITAPHMPRGELKEGIRLEAKNYFPFSIDDSFLDFEILTDVIEKGIKKYQVEVATSPKQTVEKYLSLFKKLGIKPASFIPAPYALQKLVEVFYSKGNKTMCFIDMGSQHTELAILKGRDLVFQRKIPVRGDDFTKAMTGVLVSDRGRTELSIEEAEKIKREVGIPPEGEAKMIEDKISTTQILSMTRGLLDQLVNEIGRSFDYYREESGTDKVDSLILFGGSARLKGLSEFLSDELGIEVKLGDCLKGFNVDPEAVDEKEKLSLQLNIAIGAALSEAKGINLLPPEIKEETKRAFERTTAESVAVAAILILVFIYIGMRIELVNFQKRISVANLELSSLQPQLKDVEMQNLITRILRDEPYWEDVFKELSNIIPDNIYLTELSTENKILKIKGIIVSGEAEEALSAFMVALENGIFKNVKLVSAKDIKDKEGNEFELTCWVD